MIDSSVPPQARVIGDGILVIGSKCSIPIVQIARCEVAFLNGKHWYQVYYTKDDKERCVPIECKTEADVDALCAAVTELGIEWRERQLATKMQRTHLRADILTIAGLVSVPGDTIRSMNVTKGNCIQVERFSGVIVSVPCSREEEAACLLARAAELWAQWRIAAAEKK